MAEKRTPQQVHADIQAGKYRDKTPGFDPSAAPMETDAEAGGASTHPDDEQAGRVEHPTVQNQASTGSAMRPRGKQKPRK
ncbi:hypothetical protein [Mesorhizobium retamae]|uniref:Uncharacterized protein n=1 Tax=Mesorhizobium retamae TaxID=2912854 RepID=A0ABS9QLF7_9HYPH|nr:hypothetical protein [Mesorhizobium sp. IRAMC:0171]MCG7508256.1 hypothetical protein [Mesorhizobium sp. IRAMC:0171]